MSDNPGLLDLLFSWLGRLFGAGGPAASDQRPIGVPEVLRAQMDGGAADAPPRELASAALAWTSMQLGAIMPRLPVDRRTEYFPELSFAMAEFTINTPLRAAAFLAQIAHESGELRELEENLNYSAEGLLRTFPSHFSAADAEAYARQPERIANRVYANRMGNGPEESGDGWRYRGRGPLELTGLDGYRGMGAALGVDLVNDPDLAATPAVGFRIAGRYFAVNGCNELADAGNFTGVTRAVNGGLNGLASRQAYYSRAKEALGA